MYLNIVNNSPLGVFSELVRFSLPLNVSLSPTLSQSLFPSRYQSSQSTCECDCFLFFDLNWGMHCRSQQFFGDWSPDLPTCRKAKSLIPRRKHIAIYLPVLKLNFPICLLHLRLLNQPICRNAKFRHISGERILLILLWFEKRRIHFGARKVR